MWARRWGRARTSLSGKKRRFLSKRPIFCEKGIAPVPRGVRSAAGGDLSATRGAPRVTRGDTFTARGACSAAGRELSMAWGDAFAAGGDIFTAWGVRLVTLGAPHLAEPSPLGATRTPPAAQGASAAKGFSPLGRATSRFNAARQNIFSAPDCDDGHGFKFAARFVVDGIRSRVRGVGRPHACALARPDARPARRSRVAAVASARRRVSPRRASRARSPNLAQASRHRARRVCGIALLPRAVSAAAHARCPGIRPDLPALQ